MAGVFVTGRGARVVQVRAPGRGQRQVGFEDARLDLFEQLFAQRRLIGQLCLLISVLGGQVSQHLRGIALLQPGIGIGTFGLAGNRGTGSGGVCGHAGFSWLGGACARKSVYHKPLFA
ncbi:hypothetical protein D3C85_1498480 [compost metagenome]